MAVTAKLTWDITGSCEKHRNIKLRGLKNCNSNKLKRFVMNMK